MQTVDEIAAEIVAREGGFANDPDDPGGATNFGVTIGTMRSLGRDLNQDGRVDIADVKALTQAQARQIFIEHYFQRPRLAGANAVTILQRLVARMGFACADDGVVGPKTIAAVRAAAESAPRHLADAYGIARRNYYYALADQRPASRKYARRKDGGKGGWITRAEQFMAPRYHLTTGQHRERTARWA